MSEELTDDEIARLRRLLEEDDLRKLRLHYSQLMDAGRIDELSELFTEDAVCAFGTFGVWAGREAIRENFEKVDREFHGGVPFHAVHSNTDHWVELTGPDTAIGRAYLIDMVTEKAPGELPIVVIGIYDESYRKTDGTWRIERCTLQFLWPDRRVTDVASPFGSDEHLGRPTS